MSKGRGWWNLPKDDPRRLWHRMIAAKRTKGPRKIGQRVRGIVGRDPREMARLQGLPSDFDLPGFTVHGKKSAIGNGVPLPMGRAIAKAVKRAIEQEAAA